jgi:1,4-alpha-glucan branching enzyme
MPMPGVWREVLNTDSQEFGGSGVTQKSFAVDLGTDLYVEMRIPPLATVWFEKV